MNSFEQVQGVSQLNAFKQVLEGGPEANKF